MGKGRTGLFEDVIRFIGGGADTPRATYLRSRLQNEEFARAAQAAADAGEEFKFLTRAAYEMPPPRATTDQVMEGLGFERPRTDEQIVRGSVADELGPFFREAPMEQVDDAFTALGRTDGGEDLIGRLEASAPRAEYSIPLPNNTTPAFQFSDVPSSPSRAFQISDLTPSQRSVMNPRRPAESDLMDAVRANFENRAAGMDADINALSADIAPRGDVFTQRVADGRWRPPEGPGGWPSYDQKAVARAVDAGAAQRGVPRDGDFRFDAGQRRPGFHARNVAKGVAERLPPAVAGGLAAGLGVRFAMEPGSLGDSETMGAEPATSQATADLAAEQNPPPSVMTQEPEAMSPRDQAMAMIADLNRMRREAGGEVAEAPAMQKEINRLLGQSNQAAAAASRGAVAVGGGPREQAQTLLSQLNAMRRQAGGEVPQAQQILREVARLNALSDRQTNARTTAFPR
jgi:hypothetical protein